jgi:uncharacterized protein
VECGADLNEDPDHSHEAAIDPRWERLTSLDATNQKNYNVSGPQRD